MNLFENILNKAKTGVSYLATGQAGSDLYDWANPEQQDPIQRFFDDPKQDMSKKQALMDNLKSGVPTDVMKSYVTEKYYKQPEFKQVLPTVDPTFKTSGQENAMLMGAKFIGNIPSNLYNFGAGTVNLANTAYNEGIPETASMVGKGIVKSAGENAQKVATTYQNEGLLPAINKTVGGLAKYAVENPFDVISPSLVKPAVLGTGKAIVRGVDAVAPNIVKGAKIGADVVSSPFKSVINTAKKYVGNPEEISGIQSAIKPKQRVKNGVVQRSQDAINKEITLTNSLIRESGAKPVDLETYKNAIKGEMEKIGSEINRLTGQDLTIDITPSTAKLRQLANSDIVKTLDPADTNALIGLADRLDANGGRMSLSMAEEMNQWLNSVLKDTTVPKSEAYKRGLVSLVGDIRDGLDNAISTIPGQFKDIKKAYGALRNVYGDTVAREIVFNRQNMGGLVDSIGAIDGAGNIVSGGGKILMGDVRSGVADIGRGIASNAMGRFIKSKNDPNNIIRTIFEKGGNKSTLPNIPNKPTNGTPLRNSTNSSPVLDMGTAKKAEGKIKKPIIKPNTIKNESKVSEQVVVPKKTVNTPIAKKTATEVIKPKNSIYDSQERAESYVKWYEKELAIPGRSKADIKYLQKGLEDTKQEIELWKSLNKSNAKQSVIKPRSTTTNVFGETIDKPSNKKGGFIKIPEIGKKVGPKPKSTTVDVSNIKQVSNLEKEYVTKMKKGKNLVIDSDKIKEQFSDYDPKNPTTVHEKSSELSKIYYENALKDPSYKKVVLTAGGGGSGKSEILVSGIPQDSGTLVFDGTGKNFKKIVSQYDKAKKAGKDAEIKAVYIDYNKAKQFNAKRDRTVAEDILADTHKGYRKTLLQIAKERPDINISLVKNFGVKDKNGKAISRTIDRESLVSFLEAHQELE